MKMFNASLLLLVASLLFAAYTIVKFNLTLNEMLVQGGLVEKRVECSLKLHGAKTIRNGKGELCK